MGRAGSEALVCCLPSSMRRAIPPNYQLQTSLLEGSLLYKIVPYSVSEAGWGAVQICSSRLLPESADNIYGRRPSVHLK